MTNQAKIKTVNATPVLKFKKDTVKNIMEAKENFDHNAIANKASSDFVRALGNPRNALVQLNTMFQSVAVTRGTQSIVNAINKAEAKGATDEVALIKWVTRNIFTQGTKTAGVKTKDGKVSSIFIKGITHNKVRLARLEKFANDPSNNIRTRAIKDFVLSIKPVVKVYTLEEKENKAKSSVKSLAKAFGMTFDEVKVLISNQTEATK